jgi:hydrogenase nickel incorporation protein HypA/HybF
MIRPDAGSLPAMHELAIAESVVEIALRHAGGRRVERVEVKIGDLRRVVPTALELSFELLAVDTALEGATLVIERVPVSGRCCVCAAPITDGDLPLRCSTCGSREVELWTGEELWVHGLAVGTTLALGGRARASPSSG